MEFLNTVCDLAKEQRIERRELMLAVLKTVYLAGHSGMILSDLAEKVGPTTANIAKIRNKHTGLFSSVVLDLSLPQGARNTFVSGHPDLVRHWIAA